MKRIGSLSAASQDAAIYGEALAQGVPSDVAMIIVAQARHETNDYASSLFVGSNNAFGYGASSSPTNAPFQSGSTSDGFATYSSVSNSVDNLVMWLKVNLIQNNGYDWTDINTVANYAQALSDNGYYTDNEENYATGMANRFAELNPQQIIADSATWIPGVPNTTVLIGGAVVLLLLFFAFSDD